MLQFRKFDLSDLDLIKKEFERVDTKSSDETPGVITMWRNCFCSELAETEDGIVFSVMYPNVGKSFVVPHNNKLILTERIIEYAKSHKLNPVFVSVNNSDLKFLQDNFKVKSVTPAREWFDYIYDAEKMKTFSGKKLSGQRNHKNNFIREHPDWSFAELTNENIFLAESFFFEYSSNTQKDSKTFSEEEKIVWEVLEHFDEYGFFGGMILSGGKVYALGIGEKNGDTFFVHIEKARREVNGAYQMIASELINHFADEKIKFVNREDDSGDAGLRKSKLDYKPIELFEKNIVELDY